MKKKVITAAAAAMIIAVMCILAGCSSDSEDAQTGTQIPNPVGQVGSLQEINDAVGCSMHDMDNIIAEDEKFIVINGDVPIGEYDFQVDGVSYCLRAAATKEDISGVYLEDGKTLGESANADADTDTIVFDGGQWVRWFDGDMQYSLLNNDSEADNTDGLYAIRDALK